MDTNDSRQLADTLTKAIRGNIVAAAHGAIANWESFAWHTTGGRPDAHVRHSSQAFCISVWGTFASAEGAGVRSVVSQLLGDHDLKTAIERCSSTVPIVLESDSRALLNEYGGKQSHLDVLLSPPSMTVVVESKLTEPLGECSQVKRGHCSGVYGSGSDLKLGRDVACRLEYQDRNRSPRLYWEVMAKLSKPDTYPKGEQCAFAGAGYQVMRNIAAAFQQAQKVDVDWRVIFAFRGDNATAEAISLIRQRLQDAHKRCVLILNYRELAVALARSKDLISMRLAEHMAVRLGIALPAAPSEQ